jgi:hypothetical protein
VKAPLRPASFVLALLATSAALIFGLDAVAAPTAPARIASVAFSGGSAKPTITIRGQHLGTRPLPNPAYNPLGHPPLCPPSPTKPPSAYGYDYGMSLFIEDRSQEPVWSAGRYRPALNELDCVGVVVVKFTPGLVVLRLGAFYREAKLKLAPNDEYTLGVNTARFRGRVRYG